jgi:hypothetical protein
MSKTRFTFAGVLIAAASAALFVWAVEQAGFDQVRAAAGRVGVGFVVIVLLGGVRGLCRALAWTCAVDPHERLEPWRAVTAFFAGEALGNLTPFGPIASEPVRIALVTSRLSAGTALSGRAVETLLYGATIVTIWVIGAGILLVAFSPSAASALTVVAVVAAAVGAMLVTARFGRTYGLGSVFAFVGRYPGRTLRILILEALYHVAAVAEIWVTLRFITGQAPTLATALVLECFNRALMIAFQFVPLWLGVDETGTGLVAGALHLGTATGVALALVRKGRIICWTAVGLLIAFGQGLTLRAGAAASERPAGS